MVLALLLSETSLLHAQATTTASRAGDLQFGAAYTLANSDYEQNYFRGFTAYVDFDLRAHLGLEAEFHQVSSPAGDQSFQRTYLIGPRYFRTYGLLIPYLKLMVGRGDFNYPFGHTDLAYNLYAGAIGTDCKFGPHLRLRAEYEIQSWSGFTNGSLTPQLITVGAAYHFAGKPRYK
jgi:hypothetical protein